MHFIEVLPPPNESSDQELLRGITARDQQAFDLLYSRYRALLAKIIGETLLCPADIDECLQDVFAEVWRRADTFIEEKGKPLGWMIRIARCRSIDRFRKLSRRGAWVTTSLDSGEHGEGLLGDQLGETSIPDDPSTRGQDLRQQLLALLELLPVEQKQVVYLTYFKDMTHREIAACTATPLGTIKTRLDLGMRKLARRSEHLRNELN